MFEDWDVFMDPEDFGSVANWDTATETVDVPGIFTDGHAVALDISASDLVFTVPQDAVPGEAGQGDDVEIDGANYRVSDIQPDGSGLARVILERA